MFIQIKILNEKFGLIINNLITDKFSRPKLFGQIYAIETATETTYILLKIVFSTLL